ncbi:[FeFe] hydrogenase H-cluster maturation GTPase HydF [Anaerotruncus colihominis]|uniref:[FeFe] hydrogenase H-cluster maturation GTPase HydF n=1 Tax=Anaerotruncus colihominis TaxID=169435 RepID=A0A845RKD7_9FIRM|nr:[FeFe] hydrogenase H-cluster maturation GTPase HydF [Anaerotruncus colihominis]NBI78182.1 [FeFe] hydrogenase H-cluster maturation GTPase HydF [Anaerotruncus colihominis]
MSLTSTPSANRLHIGIFGKRNSGKSSLINAITGQNTAVTSDIAGTTTDPVYKAMEIHGIGPCMLIDTAGFDDEGALGALRVEKTRDALAKTDVAVMLFCDAGLTWEQEWIDALRAQKTPVVAVVNKADILPNIPEIAGAVHAAFGLFPIVASAKDGSGIKDVIEAVIRQMPEDYEKKSATGGLVSDGDVVLLVMPQDIQAPKGRLILPQVQTIRDLLDRRCVVISVTADKLDAGLAALERPPRLIITDSQVFPQVYAKKPPQTLLTSFSVLMAGVKGDINAFVEGAAAIDALTKDSRVLIAEACTHAPLEEDIGRVKLPRLLRARVGGELAVDIVSGPDFPDDLSGYSLIIHCGACMFNRRYVLARIEKARAAGVPITNYGVALAKLGGILDRIAY